MTGPISLVSYNNIELSCAPAPSRLFSTGLNFTKWIESTPHLNVLKWNMIDCMRKNVFYEAVVVKYLFHLQRKYFNRLKSLVRRLFEYGWIVYYIAGYFNIIFIRVILKWVWLRQIIVNPSTTTIEYLWIVGVRNNKLC